MDKAGRWREAPSADEGMASRHSGRVARISGRSRSDGQLLLRLEDRPMLSTGRDRVEGTWESRDRSVVDVIQVDDVGKGVEARESLGRRGCLAQGRRLDGR